MATAKGGGESASGLGGLVVAPQKGRVAEGSGEERAAGVAVEGARSSGPVPVWDFRR